MHEPSIQHRLQEIWTGLDQEERLALSEMQKLQIRQMAVSQEKVRNGSRAAAWPNLEQQLGEVLSRLAVKGLCQQSDSGWRIFSDLFAAYAATVAGRGQGKVWLDKQTGEVYQGQSHLRDLAPLERAVLHFLLQHPRIRHTKTDLIVNAWPDKLRQQGVTDDSLYQVITGLRKKIEPLPSKPCYIVNWRGHPEGGYQLFPEGRPG